MSQNLISPSDHGMPVWANSGSRQMVISRISHGGSAPVKEVTNGGREKKADTGSRQTAKEMVFAGRKIDDGAMRIEWKNPSRFRQVGR
ncbi:hypothetical protein [Bradyrhizobium embrapense]